ncbi:MAG: succinate dehydrogenase, hydrophobic membrane anchor protein [Alphaproteobacteria bacterium RIFCSPHIGHO2_12_FULL_63_12]|nr:MAG: succinate dehydrogenase, hydrophobic membrane anchor protein [Alphaproteobacteria bacterium RIFCSPHIGHO2_12_FULL_63_12]
MTNKGTANFIAQRASAALLAPLALWFLWSAVAHAGVSYEEMRAWIAGPAAAIPMGLLILVGALHMRIGLNDIIDDYIDSGARGVFKLLNLLACLGVAALGLWSLYVLSV